MSMNLTPINKDLDNLITKTPLFNDNERQELMNAKDSMNHAFKYSQIFRTDTEARVSVLNPTKHPTPSSKWFQALRELNVHQSELAYLLFDYQIKQQDSEILVIEIEELQYQINNSDKFGLDDFQIRKLKCEINKKQIELDKYNFSLREIKRIADDRKREILMWHNILEELKPQIENNNISLTDPNEHQLLSYLKNIQYQLEHFSGSKDTKQNLKHQYNELLKLSEHKGCKDKFLNNINPKNQLPSM